MNIQNDHGWYALRFWYKGIRRAEYLGLKATKENLPLVRAKAKQVNEAMIRDVDGWYEAMFPKSKFAKARSKSATLGEWADKWIDALEHELVSETAEDYRSMIALHIKPAKIGSKLPSDIT